MTKGKKSKSSEPGKKQQDRLRWMTPAERDAELLGRLRETVSALEAGKPVAQPIATWLSYGAAIALAPEEQDPPPALARYFVGDRPVSPLPSRAGKVGIAAVRCDEDEWQAALESIRPGADWPAEHVAMFWRTIAAAYADRYSDSLLNLRARALGAAVPWFAEHDPEVAIRMHAERARVLMYASYPEAEVLPAIDAALALHQQHALPARREYELLLQACEVLARLGAPGRGNQLLALARRGLELASSLDQPKQRCELHHAMGAALALARPPASPDDALARAHGTKDPLALADACWRRAIELVDDSFYGISESWRRDKRLEAYERGRAIVALRQGELERGLDALAPASGKPMSDRAMAQLFRELREWGLGISDRLRIVEGLLHRELAVKIAGPDKAYEADMALRRRELLLRELANLGAGQEVAVMVEAAMSPRWIAAAQKRRDRLRDRFSGDDDDFADETPAQPRGFARLPGETGENHVWRVVDEIVDVVLDRNRWGVLIRRLIDASPDGKRVQLTLELGCPDALRDALCSQPEVTALLRSFEARVREALAGTQVVFEITNRSIEQRPGEPAWLAAALTQAGARRTLAALGLKPRTADRRQLRRERENAELV